MCIQDSLLYHVLDPIYDRNLLTKLRAISFYLERGFGGGWVNFFGFGPSGPELI